MSTVIFLSNTEVKAVVGTTGRPIQITKACLGQAPEGSIINGQVIDEENFTAFLSEFWKENQLPTKDVVFVMGTNQGVTRMLQIPKMTNKKLMEYLPREFAATIDWQSSVLSYTTLAEKDKMMIIGASVIDKSYVEPHIKRFKKMGISLSSIVISHVAGMLAMEHLGYMKDENAIVQILDGMNLMNILYLKGRYFQHSTSRIFGERGSLAFGIESARNVSHLQQFLKAEDASAVITNVYLGGEFGPADVEVCTESINQMDADIDVEMLRSEKDGDIQFPDSLGQPFAKYSTAIGGLFANRGPGNLLQEYSRDPEKEKERRDLIHSFVPAVVLVGVLAFTTAAMGFVWMRRTKQVNEQLAYLNDPAVVEQVAKYDEISAENGAMQSQLDTMDKTLDYLDTYPAYDSSIKAAIEACAPSGTTANVNGYIMENGAVSVEAYSTNMEGIQVLVRQLEDRDDLFSQVDYSGFEQDSRSGSWRSSIHCYLHGNQLAAQPATEEVTP